MSPSPERRLALTRARWAIENKLRHVRDVSMAKDRCRVRNVALGSIRRTGQATREVRENDSEDRSEAIQAVTGKML